MALRAIDSGARRFAGFSRDSSALGAIAPRAGQALTGVTLTGSSPSYISSDKWIEGGPRSALGLGFDRGLSLLGEGL